MIIQGKLNKTNYFKIISWLAIAGGLMGLVSLAILVGNAKQNEIAGFYYVFVLNCVGCVGGIKLLKKELLGLQLLTIFFGLQTLAIVSPYFYINLISGISVNLHLKIHEYAFTVNFYALVFFVLSLELIWEHKKLPHTSIANVPANESP
jgi:hypothetical protein